jgi:hypothetical protein
MISNNAQRYIVIGAILTTLSFFACFYGNSYNSEINENTQIALGFYIHGLKHQLVNETKESIECWNDGNNQTGKYSELNFRRRGLYYLGLIFAIGSMIAYFFSFRAVSNADKIAAKKEADKIAAEKAEADKIAAEKAKDDEMAAESLRSYV